MRDVGGVRGRSVGKDVSVALAAREVLPAGVGVCASYCHDRRRRSRVSVDIGGGREGGGGGGRSRLLPAAPAFPDGWLRRWRLFPPFPPLPPLAERR